MIDNPIIQRAVVFKFKGAQGMRHTLDCVLNRMREIVHRVNAPGIPRAVVRDTVDAVQNRVTHIEVAGSQVDFRPKRHFAVLEFPCPHAAE